VTLPRVAEREGHGGTYDARVSYLGAPLLHTSGNLADVVHLPLPAGSFSLHKRYHGPRPGTVGQIHPAPERANQHDRQLLCCQTCPSA